MKLSDLSIERPVLATVMNLMIVVAGVIAYFALPVREYPDIDSPFVSVYTIYPGASPQTIESTVTEPLEQALNGIEGIRSISSVSSYSTSSINLEFETGRDLDLAANDVSNKLQRSLGLLPQEAERPVVSKSGLESGSIMWMSLRSETYSAVDRTDIADRIVKTPLQLLPGVAQVIIAGERRYAMRVWLDPSSMAAHGVDAGDVRRAILENNIQAPAGELESETRKFTINIDAQIDDPRVYERLVIREDRGAPVRIEDVGWVELGSENYQTITRADGEDTVGIGIIRQSKSNELEVGRAVRAGVERIKPFLPEGVNLRTATDRTIFVEASLQQVRQTLLIVFALVILVNLIFLRSPVTTLITAVAIPISLVGTLAAMQLFGFSINVLTLLAMVLAIGLLVDDSIVVMENIYRRQEMGEGPYAAALKGAKEVGFPVIATTAAVVAVLIPLSLMTGSTGRLFREFALTMAVAVLISTFVALTAVPMLCSKFLRLSREHGRVFRAIEVVLTGLTTVYRRTLAWTLDHRLVIGAALAVTLAAAVWMFRLLPSTLVPTEDRGEFITFIRAPQGSTAAYTERALRQVEEATLAVPEVEAIFGAVAMNFGGQQNTNEGLVFTRLKRWENRTRKQQEIVGQLARQFFGITQALAFAINPPSLGQSRRSADIQVILKSSSADLEEFQQLTRAIVQRARQIPGLYNVDTDTQLESPQLDIVIDRERAADIGVPASEVAETIRLLVSQGRMDDFILRNKQYDVVMALASQYRSVPDQLGEIHVRAADGSMVPLSSLVRAVPRIGPSSLSHFDLQRSASVTANLAPNATMGEALPEVMAIVNEELPEGFSTDLGAVSREFVESSGAMTLTFGIALLVIYLVLSAQFESFVHPLTVMFSVPLAALGAFATLWLTGNTLNLYSGIGLVLLIGLVTKNSILLVDFANQERARGGELLDALRAAGRTRFRPILMTSMTSILGAMPLALAVGAGAEGRRPIGAAVVGGLLFSTLFTLLVIPAVHYTVIRIAERLGLKTVPPLVVLEPTPLG